jgi:23S rRNA pseudouridine1911/1915/1917 synthase
MTTPSQEPSIFTDSSFSPTAVNLEVLPEHSGSRFDHFLVQRIADSSRNLLNLSIRKGLLRVDGQIKKSSYKLKVGELVSGTIFKAAAPVLSAQKVSFDILFEDDFLIVISKPPGLVVHPAHGNPDGTLVNGLLYYCNSIAGVGDEIRPGIVHRLDKDTSGIMVVAKTELVHRKLSDNFKSRDIEKEYLALVRGILKEKAGRIVANVGRHPVKRQKMAVCGEGRGRYAASSWHVLEEYGTDWSLLQVKIETGRTHQIRVHMASLHHPVAGDTLYGRGRQAMKFPRQMLHAHRLRLTHPITAEPLSFTAPLWPDFQERVAELRACGFERIACV